MVTLRIEHPVPNYDAWRRAFDGDPLDRTGSGVRRHRVLRSLDDPSVVFVDLDFDDRAQAEAMREALRRLWARVQPEGLIDDQQVRLAELLETVET